jgi:hypothetical protein
MGYCLYYRARIALTSTLSRGNGVRLCGNPSSRPSTAKRCASRDPDDVPANAGKQAPRKVIAVFWIPDLIRLDGLVRNDGFGE